MGTVPPGILSHSDLGGWAVKPLLTWTAPCRTPGIEQGYEFSDFNDDEGAS